MRQVRNLILTALLTATVSFAFGWTLLLLAIAFLVGAMATGVRIIYWEWDQEWFAIALASIVGSCVGGYVWYRCMGNAVEATAGALFAPSFILGSALMAFVQWSLMKIVRAARRSYRRRGNAVLLAMVSAVLVLPLTATDSFSQGWTYTGKDHNELIRASTIPDLATLLGQNVLYIRQKDSDHTSYGAIISGFEINDYSVKLYLSGQPLTTYLQFTPAEYAPAGWQLINVLGQLDFQRQQPIDLYWLKVTESSYVTKKKK